MYFMFIFFKRQKERYYLYFSLLSLSIGLWIIGYKHLILFLFDHQIVYIFITYIPAITVCIFLLEFIHSYFNIEKNITVKILIIIFIILACELLVEQTITSQITYYARYLYSIFMVLSLLSIIYSISISIKEISKNTPYSNRILISLIILLLTTGYSSLTFMDIIKSEPVLVEGFFIMSLIFASILASRFAQVHTDLEKAHNDLLVLDKMKDDFLATTSHELRTPLHGIMGIAESLTDGTLGPVNAAQKENLELIRSSSSHLTSLVNEILDFSKMRAGRADLILDNIRVDDIAATVVSLLRPSAAERGLEITADLKKPPAIKADRNRLRQIFINLVGNAVKYTETGSITVTVEPAESGVRVTVRDTGPGIDAKDLERIWEPFTQAEDPDRRRAGGTGLGLAITKYLVELHDGRIWAESEKGKGSAFMFELPAEPKSRGILKETAAIEPLQPSAGEAAIAVAEPSEDQGYRIKSKYSSAVILAVDDDPVSIRVVENLCLLVGYDLVTAANGPEALSVIYEREVDLVLLDLMLPGMSGFEVCQEIRKLEKARYIPIIMVTARDGTGDLVKGFTTGANDYVTKPFNREELLVRIENQLVIKQMLDMEKSVINGLRQEKDSISNLYQRSMDLKESTLQMVEWEHIIREDLDIATSFQLKLMTHERSIPGIETSVRYRPLLKIGGDLYDIFEFRPGVARVFIADATGHGITASLNTVKILSEYAAVKETLSAPEVVMNYMNRRFVQLFRDYQIVFTCVVADINIAESTIVAAQAGHPAQLILRGRESIQVRPPGPIIGFSAQMEYQEETHEFRQGDIFFLYTDGLLELSQPDAGGPLPYDTDILAKAVADSFDARGIEEGGEELLKQFRAGRKRLDDDVTFIAIRKL
ncbi:MAG: SpoIIE family protein phosphatase [Spirochaetes bacterium]|nr:SpoIIE family protein phosphatase [Spirochaetota bacterium]